MFRAQICFIPKYTWTCKMNTENTTMAKLKQRYFMRTWWRIEKSLYSNISKWQCLSKMEAPFAVIFEGIIDRLLCWRTAEWRSVDWAESRVCSSVWRDAVKSHTQQKRPREPVHSGSCIGTPATTALLWTFIISTWMPTLCPPSCCTVSCWEYTLCCHFIISGMRPTHLGLFSAPRILQNLLRVALNSVEPAFGSSGESGAA